jgi:hypothetical protein
VRVVTIPHPIAGATPDQIRRFAATAVEAILRLLAAPWCAV